MKTERKSHWIEKGLRLFRTSYRDKAGVKHWSKDWWIEFRDQDRIIRRIPGFTDKAQSIDLARRIKKLVAWRVSGEIPDADTQRWIETMPDDLRGRLAKISLLDARRVAAGKPLAEHLADFKAALVDKGNTARHAELVESRAGNVIEGCGFKVWSDLSASTVQRFISDKRKDRKGKVEGETIRGISAQTFNFYLAAVKQFCRWMVSERRAQENPLAHLTGLNVKTDRRHDRRALTPEELRCVIEAAEAGPVRFKISGADRAMLYRFIAETGLRPGEVRSLTRGSFELDVDEPCVKVAAAYSKHRREDVQPLKAETAEA